MLYTNPEDKQVEVYVILAVEERDSLTVQLIIDCAVRQNKQIISRDAYRAHKPMVKDYLTIDPMTGVLTIVPRATPALLGTPVTTKPPLGAPEPPPVTPVISPVVAPAKVATPVAPETPVVPATLSVDLPEESIITNANKGPMALSRLSKPIIPPAE